MVAVAVAVAVCVSVCTLRVVNLRFINKSLCFQVQERERIRQDELEYLRQRFVCLESKNSTQEIRL